MIDNQGRCVITDHGAFVLFNIYGPAVTSELNERFAFKMRFYQVRRCSRNAPCNPYSLQPVPMLLQLSFSFGSVHEQGTLESDPSHKMP